MKAENEFFIWEEKNSTDQQQNLSKNVENDSCGITTEIKSNLIKNDVKDIGKISGIYKIINKINGKYYVGSSSVVCNRWYKHLWYLKNNCHPNIHLQSAWNKYGESAFDFIVVEKVPKEKLIEIEQKYLDTIEKDKCYNKSFTADRVDFTDEVKKKISNSKMGKRQPDKHREKNRLSHLKIFDGLKNPAADKTIYAFYNEQTKEIFPGTRFDFYTQFGLKHQMSHISHLINGKRKHVKHWIIKDL